MIIIAQIAVVAVLVAVTAGTLLSLYLMILIVGYRRRRTFERVLFFLALALFWYYAGILLWMNASIYYADLFPAASGILTELLVSLAVVLLPGLLVHTHFTYGWTELRIARRWWHTVLVALTYLPGGLLGISLLSTGSMSFIVFPFQERAVVARFHLIWITCAMLVCVAFQLVFVRRVQGAPRRAFHNFLALYFAAVGLLSISILLINTTIQNREAVWLIPDGDFGLWKLIALPLVWIPPLAVVVYAIVRHRVLGIGSQKNLVYSLSIAFLAVLYLSVVRRISGLLEPYFPPEATAAFLLFLLLALFEPLQRLASRLLRRGFQEQVDRLQRLSAELQREALRGESGRLIEFAEEHIRQEFGLESVRIHLNPVGASGDGASAAGTTRERQRDVASEARPAWAGQPVRLRLGKPGAEMGELEVVPVGSAISGETSAALDFLAEQLPAVIELCRVIEQKVALERELDERERMALVGQMAASISHNLKNPLGSMKTILQVQLENSSLPADARRDLAMVLSELDRLSSKLNQLLQYARPAVRSSGATPTQVDLGAVAEQVASLLRHDAERRRVRLTLSDESRGALINGPQEALADILSNLVVNAIEAVADGGAVSVRVTREANEVLLSVEDDGLGIAAENRADVFQPFFTTKPSGTGLGLAIVERRVTELGGSVRCESPIANGRGARFIVRLPIANASAAEITGE